MLFCNNLIFSYEFILSKMSFIVLKRVEDYIYRFYIHVNSTPLISINNIPKEALHLSINNIKTLL